tara:strand:- start:5231 stop:5641 length:411 start_codon:yes stop_codon:yes gene_type:complete
MIKLYVLIVVLGFVGAAIYGGYYYYKDTQARINILNKNNAKLEVATKQQETTINTLLADRAKFEELNKDLQSKLVHANDYKNKLIDKLRKHNLAKLSMKKPGLVEKKINRGTKKLFESFEKLTGATPTSKPVSSSK